MVTVQKLSLCGRQYSGCIFQITYSNMHIPEYNPTNKLHLRTLHREACTGRFTWYMSCTFQTWNSTKNNNFHQEFDSLITYLRWLDQITYLTPRWHQVSFREFSWEEFCHLQIWSAKSKTMLCNQQTWRQEMFPDKVFPSHTVPQVLLRVLCLSISSEKGYRIWTLSFPYSPAMLWISQDIFPLTGISQQSWTLAHLTEISVCRCKTDQPWTWKHLWN